MIQVNFDNNTFHLFIYLLIYYYLFIIEEAFNRYIENCFKYEEVIIKDTPLTNSNATLIAEKTRGNKNLKVLMYFFF